MNDGFILLSRTLLDSDVFASQKLLKIWIWCLCKANFKDRSVPLKVGKGETIIKVKRGSFIFGRFKAEEELFIDGSTIYKSMKKLQEMNMVKIESNNQYSIVTICKYEEYQQSDNYHVASKEQPSNSQVTANEQPSNTTKNDNNVNKDNKGVEKKFSHPLEELNNKTELDENKFLNWFNDRRTKYLQLQSNFKKLTADDRRNLKSLKETYTNEDFEAAIINICNDKWANEEKQVTLSHFLKEDNFTRYLNMEVQKPKTLHQKRLAGWSI